MRRFFLLSSLTLLKVDSSHEDSSLCPLPGAINEGLRYPGTDFYDKIDNIGPMQCHRECSLVTICQSVNYDKQRFTCYLYNFRVNMSALETDASLILINDIIRTKELMGTCFNHRCSNEEMCVELNSAPVCVRPGCRHKQYNIDEMTRTCSRILTTPMRWVDAKEYCERDGTRLIKLDNSHKNDKITGALSNYTSRFWIGLTDRDTEGIFSWVDGSRLTDQSYRNWDAYQPNDRYTGCSTGLRNADCVIIIPYGKWADDCCEDQNGFICEII